MFASASGTGSESTTVFVGLPAGRTYENPDMLITISPTLAAHADRAGDWGADAYANVLAASSSLHELCRRPNTTADRAADLLAATSALAISPRGARDRRPGSRSG